MNIITTCLAVGVALVVATPAAAATPRSSVTTNPPVHASAVLPLPPFARAIRLAERVRVPVRRIQRFRKDTAPYRLAYKRVTWREKWERYCEDLQALFGYQVRCYGYGSYAVCYLYDECKRYG